METGVNSFSRFKEAFRLKEADASQYSPLVLAYIGDAVYEIMIRTKVVNDGNVQVNGDVNATGSVMDGSGNSNHHSH